MKTRRFLPHSQHRSNFFSSLVFCAAISVVVCVDSAHAANFTMTTSDLDSAGLPTSFNSGLNWAGGAAPAAGNTYQTGAFIIRTPKNTTALTFLGDSLEVASGGSFRHKTAAIITVNNLIVANTGVVEMTRPNNVNTAAAVGTLAGNITLNGTAVFHSGITGDVVGETFTISSAIGGTGGFSTTGSNGKIILTGSNTFSGGVAVGGLAGSLLQLGNANAVQNSTVSINAANGLTFSPGIGIFNFGGLSGTLGETLTDTGGAGVTLAVGGNSASSAYSGSLSGLGGISKSGTGTFTLSGSNSYSGATSVNAGTLQVTGSLDAASIVSINGGGTLAGRGDGFTTGLINGPVSVAGGVTPETRGTISLVNGTNDTLTFGNAAGLTLGGDAGNPAQLALEADSATSDQLSLGTNPLIVNAGGATINITNAGVISNQSYTLITFGSGSGAGFVTGSGVSVGGLTLANPNISFGVTGSLVVESDKVRLVTTGATASGTAYWSGVRGTQWTDNNGSLGNFTTDAAGSQFVGAYPVSSTNVVYAAAGNGAPVNLLTSTLGQNFSINSLTFGSGTATSVIGGNNTLTIGVGGVLLANGNGGATLSMTSMTLADSQIWKNASAQNLIVSSNVGGTGGLTFNNISTGATVLGGLSSYSGGSTLSAGVLRMSGNSASGTNGSLGSTSGNLVIDGGRLELNGTNQGVGDLGGLGGQIVNNGIANSVLTIGNGNNGGGSYPGLLTDTTNGSAGTLGLAKAGTATSTLTAVNTYTGPTTLAGGILSIATFGNGGVASGIGQAANTADKLVFAGGTLQYTGPAVTSDRNFTIVDATTGGLDIANQVTLTGVSAVTTGSFTKAGDGELVLPGIHGYSGRTTINGGLVSLTGTLNSGGALGFGSLVVGGIGGNAALRVSGGTIHLGGSGPAVNVSGSIGHVTGSHGSLVMTSGSIISNSGTVKQNINTGVSGYGAFTMTAGTITLAGNFGAGTLAGGVGVQNFSGGSITVENGYAGILGNVATGLGIANYTGTSSFTSASATVLPAPAFIGMAVGEAGAGILNVSGQATLTLGGATASAGLDIGRTSAATSSGIVNLGAVGAGGGTIITNAVRHTGVAATGIFNFHGGTLRAATFADPAFMTGLTGTYIYSEGSTIDSNGASVAVAQPLLAPTGQGITSIPVTVNGTGYINTPAVTVSGGTLTAPGTQATAVANFNSATGEVTGFTITNPGSYSDTTGIALVIAGGGTQAIAPEYGTPTSSANISGGLVKSGTGTLALGGVNTYTGSTTVTNGVLQVNGTLSAGSAVTVNSGATLSGSGIVSGPVTTVGTNSKIAPGLAGIGTLTTGSASITGVLETELNATVGDQLNVAGNLTIDPSATLSFIPLSVPAASKYVIAKYSGTLTGTFATPALPSGYSINYDLGAKEISIAKVGFSGFMDNFLSLTAGEKAPSADPDHDGISNLMEYALNGFDPTVGNGLPGSFSGGVISFSKRALAVTNGDVTYLIETSASLGIADPWVTAVTSPANDPNPITYTFPTGQPKRFARLKVVLTP